MSVNTDIPERAISETKTWVLEFVIGHNLCPFARKPFETDQIRFVVSEALEDEALLHALAQELELLSSDSTIETTLLILPNTLVNFDEFWNFTGLAEALIESLQLEGIFQIATFHPQYQFEGTQTDSPENRTNRSPYPTLHLLRESSLEYAIANHPNVASIPRQNTKLMRTLED